MFIKGQFDIDASRLKKCIEDTQNRRNTMVSLHERYKVSEKGVPVKMRRYTIGGVEQTNKINNKINNDFFGEIVDTKTGFFLGVPIVYSVDEKEYGESQKEVIDQYITDFNTDNQIADLDSETAKRTAIYGECGRLVYLEDGAMKVKLYEGYDCIFVGDKISEPYTAIYYYYEKDEKKTIAYVYDEFNVTKYEKPDDKEEYTIVEAPTPHLLSYCPLFGFANNDELLGDAENVISSIDAYDRVLSDINNELEQFRLAYMLFTGVKPTEETLQEAVKSGAFYVPNPDGTITFITKEMSDAIIEHHLDRLEANIYRFSKTPNMKDISFAGNLTGVAMAYKFRPFEYKCKTMELKFKSSLMYQYKVMQTILNAINIPLDYRDIDFIFTRNYPQNLLEEAQILSLLKGNVSQKTALSQMSFIDDPLAEIEQLQEDNLNMLPTNLFGDDMQGVNTDSQSMATPIDVEAESKAKLKGTVGGVQGILQIQESFANGITTREAAIAMLVEIYGFTSAVASRLLGQPKKIKQSTGNAVQQ